MVFESYFFDKRATINYRVFRVMKALQSSNFTINRLSQVTGLSYSQTYNAFQDIMAGLQQMHEKPVKTTTEVAFTELAGKLTVDQYRFHLLANSMAFQFFDYLFKTEKPDVHDFCKVNQLSISTLRRRIDPFKVYIQAHNITLNASTWALEGSEMQIRLLMLTFFQLAYRGNGWPFSTTNLAQTRATFSTIQAQKAPFLPEVQPNVTKQDLLMLAIQLMRIAQGHVLEETDRLMLLVVGEEEDPLPLIFTSERFPALSTPQLAAECAFYCFTRIHFISIENTLSARDQWLLDHFAATDNLVARFAGGMLDALCNAAQPDSSEADPANHSVLHANLTRLAYTYYLLDGDFTKRLDFAHGDDEGATQGTLPRLITHFIDDLSSDKPEVIFKRYRNEMSRELYHIIRPDFPGLNQDHNLKVSVLIEPGTFVTRDLMMFLNKISFITLQPAITGPLPDVLITTLTNRKLLNRFYPKLANSSIQVIQWQNEASDNDFFKLYTQLAHALRPTKQRSKKS